MPVDKSAVKLARIKAAAPHKGTPDLHTMNERVIRLLNHAIDCCETEAYGGMGFKALTLDTKWMEKLSKLVSSLNSHNDAHIRLARTEKTLLSKMDQSDKLKYLANYLMSIPSPERRRWLIEVMRRHGNSNVVAVGGNQAPMDDSSLK